MIRISDEEETGSTIAMNDPALLEGSTFFSRVARTYLGSSGISPDHFSLLLVGLEGTREENQLLRREIRRALAPCRHAALGGSAGRKWLKSRFLLPYLRDDLLNQGCLIDTLETAACWSGLPALYQAARQAILDACRRDGAPAVCYAHVSHLYPDGASLYFTILARQVEGDALGQWERMKRAASEAIVAAGGVISHHHGIGVDHKAYLSWGKAGTAMIRAAKAAADPQGLMNPGKVL